MTVLVVTGVGREARIAAGPGRQTLCSGGSPNRLRRLLAEREPKGISGVVSFGIAGGLDPNLSPGQVIIATAAKSAGGSHPADPVWATAMLRHLHQIPGVKARGGLLFGADQALLDPAAKASARAANGADAVDMESHIAGAYAAESGVPFAAIRVICDGAGDRLPPLVNEALHPDGRVSLRGVFHSLVKEPGQIGDLLRLARSSRTAFAVLARTAAALAVSPLSSRNRR